MIEKRVGEGEGYVGLKSMPRERNFGFLTVCPMEKTGQ